MCIFTIFLLNNSPIPGLFRAIKNQLNHTVFNWYQMTSCLLVSTCFSATLETIPFVKHPPVGLLLLELMGNARRLGWRFTIKHTHWSMFTVSLGGKS